MVTRGTLAVSLCLGLVASGCSEPASDDDTAQHVPGQFSERERAEVAATATPIAQAQLCASIARVACDAEVRCCNDAARRYANPETCMQALGTDGLCEFIGQHQRFADPVQNGIEIALLQDSTEQCGVPYTTFTGGDCDACAQGLVCAPSFSENLADYACRAPKLKGERCLTRKHCAVGLACTVVGELDVVPTSGDQIESPGLECHPPAPLGSGCLESGGCSSGWCFGGACASFDPAVAYCMNPSAGG
jgi:hypothetical protein